MKALLYFPFKLIKNVPTDDTFFFLLVGKTQDFNSVCHLHTEVTVKNFREHL